MYAFCVFVFCVSEGIAKLRYCSRYPCKSSSGYHSQKCYGIDFERESSYLSGELSHRGLQTYDACGSCWQVLKMPRRRISIVRKTVIEGRSSSKQHETEAERSIDRQHNSGETRLELQQLTKRPNERTDIDVVRQHRRPVYVDDAIRGSDQRASTQRPARSSGIGDSVNSVWICCCR